MSNRIRQRSSGHLCASSGDTHLKGENPFGFTPHQERREGKGLFVECPTCGRMLKQLKHPGSPHRFFVIPWHKPARD